MGAFIVSLYMQYQGSFKGREFNRRFTGCPQGGSPGGSRAVDASQSYQGFPRFAGNRKWSRPNLWTAGDNNCIFVVPPKVFPYRGLVIYYIFNNMIPTASHGQWKSSYEIISGIQ